MRWNVSSIYVHLNLSAVSFPPNNTNESYLDLDSHADTCVLGNNALIVETSHPDRTAIVSFADPAVGTVTKPILSGALLYTSTKDGLSYILIIHQAIYIDTIDHSLLCPMQLRDNDVLVNECPKSKALVPTEEHHTIKAITEFNQTLTIPLKLRGVSSTMIVSKPTLKQYNTLTHVTLTSQDLIWDPHNKDYEADEDMFFDATGGFQIPAERDLQHSKYAIRSLRSKSQAKLTISALNRLLEKSAYTQQGEAILNEIDPTLNEGTFSTLLKANRFISATSTSNRTGLKPEALAKKWKIPLRQAENTLTTDF